MSGGVAGGPSLWTRFSHRREEDLPWEWLGDNPLCPNSAEFGNRHRSSHQEIRCRLHNSDIEFRVMYMCCGGLYDSVIMRKIAWFLFIIELHDSLIRLAYPCFLCFCLVLYVSFCDDHLFGGSRCGCSVKGIYGG